MNPEVGHVYRCRDKSVPEANAFFAHVIERNDPVVTYAERGKAPVTLSVREFTGLIEVETEGEPPYQDLAKVKEAQERHDEARARADKLNEAAAKKAAADDEAARKRAGTQEAHDAAAADARVAKAPGASADEVANPKAPAKGKGHG